MSYTKKNLDEVEDSAPKFGYEELQEARFAGEDLDAETTGVAFMRVKPGQRQGFAHRHEQAEEVYVVIAGSGRIKLDDEVVDVQGPACVRVAPSTVRSIWNDDAEDGHLLIVSTRLPDAAGDDAVIVENFWPE